MRGLVPPVEFIGVAESTGLILPLGEWVLNEACRQASAWRRAGTVDRDFYVSVNLSLRELAEPSLVDSVERALRESELPPGALVLEITESMLMRNVDTGLARMQSLKDLGVRIAIDDYGTNYSSMSRLSTLPIDTIKIDKTFVDHLTVSAAGRSMVQSIVDLTRALRMTSIAEGVEHSAQQVALQELGCHSIQGYLFAKPMCAADTGRTLQELRIRRAPRDAA